MKTNAVQNKNTISGVYCSSRSFEHQGIHLPSSLRVEGVNISEISLLVGGGGGVWSEIFILVRRSYIVGGGRGEWGESRNFEVKIKTA